MEFDAPSKSEWIDRIDRGLATWEELVAKASEAGVDRPGVTGDWTFKDVAGHLNGWRELTMNRLEAAVRGAEIATLPWLPDMDEETDEGTEQINVWIYERNRDRTAEAIFAESREQFHQIREAVEAIPALSLQARFPFLSDHPLSAVISGSLEHLHEDHEPDIRAWLADQASM